MFWDLFLSFLQIGALSFGGGLAALPLIQDQVVTKHAWMTMTQFTDLISIAQMTPGPIAVNSATFVGINLCGLPGAIVATIGCILPACAFVSFLGYFYYKYTDVALLQGVLAGLRPAVVAMIASAGVTIIILAFWGGQGISAGESILSTINWYAVGIFAISFTILRLKNINPIYLLMGSGVLGGAMYIALGVV
jgi:chromate transporter